MPTGFLLCICWPPESWQVLPVMVQSGCGMWQMAAVWAHFRDILVVFVYNRCLQVNLSVVVGTPSRYGMQPSTAVCTLCQSTVTLSVCIGCPGAGWPVV